MLRPVVFLLLLLPLAACSRGDGQANATALQAAAAPPPSDLSPLETKALAVFDAQKKAEHANEQLLAATKKTMAAYLFDPFSAHYRKLRAGRNGAICGQYNAKNRMGAYTGFRDFVIPRDRSTVYYSESSGGLTSDLYSAFSTAYVGSCATQAEVRLYNVLTSPPPAMQTTPSTPDPTLGNQI